MNRLDLVLLIHAHQPVGNFDSVLEEVYRLAYQPFLDELDRHPSIRAAFHYSGVLLAWLEKRRPAYLDTLRALAARGQIELVGGGFYEPILSAIPDRDRRAQIERMSDWIERRFGCRPRGTWLTERVWDPSLARTLAEAGIAYTLTDDCHFLSAGISEDELHGYYLTEWQGGVVKVIPGLKQLRYLLPFRMEPEVMGALQSLAGRHPGGMAAMGDDLEKFGAWPHTHQHVYTDGWLRRFCEAVEQAAGWLTTALPGDYVASHPPLGRVYLPTASYQEMTAWSLPASAAGDYQQLLGRVEQMPDAARLRRFVHGGLWLNFFHKYEEANLLHKRMLDLSRRFADLDLTLPPGGEDRAAFRQGYERLLAAQCNDAYWHGVFGGLYAPHLRSALYQALLAAEGAIEKLEGPRSSARRFDLNVDGWDEILLSNGSLGLVVTPADGGSVAEIAWRPRAINVVNSLRRRPETYHARLRQAARPEDQGGSIHDRVVAKEPGLERYLLYDRYHRSAFRSLAFAAGRTLEDYRYGRLEESQELAAGSFEILSAGVDCCRLRRAASDCLCEAATEFSIRDSTLLAEWTLRNRGLAELAAGLELVLNLCAPDAHDRYFELPDRADRPRLGFDGETQGERVSLVDQWLDLRIDITASPPALWWILPIFTVSLSEEGFERVYQGSAILPHWPAAGPELRATLRLDFGPAR